MKYQYDDHWTRHARAICRDLDFTHIPQDRIACLKSTGSKSRRTIARIHTMSKVVQIGMQYRPAYVIELISEKFDRQSDDEKTKTLIHELLHIPHSFNGGFRQHKPYVTHANVDQFFRQLKQNRKSSDQTLILP